MKYSGEEKFPLTNVQLAYLMGRDKIYELGGISTHIYYEIQNTLDIDKFEIALNKVIKHQPMLRAIIEKSGEQRILDRVDDYKINIFDISNLDENEQKNFIENKRDKMSHYVFQEDQWPLFQVEVAKLNENDTYMFLSFDLLIADGSSLIILIEEIMELYNNPNKKIEPLKVNFKDYVLFEDENKKSELYKLDKEYWKNKVPMIALPPQLPTKSMAYGDKTRFNRISYRLNKETWEKVKDICLRNSVTPTVALCALYGKVLGYWSNQDDFTINLTTSNRQKMKGLINNVIGDFTSATIMEINNKKFKENDFWNYAKKIQISMFEAYKHRYYDGFEVIKDFAKYNDMKNEAVMPVVFTSLLSGSGSKAFEHVLGNLKYSISQTPQVFLDCQIIEINGELSITWDYVENKFDDQIIKQMFGQYSKMVSSLVDKCLDVDKILDLSDNDKQLIKNYNNTGENQTITNLSELIMESLLNGKSKIAIKDENDSLTYEELNILSDEVALSLSNEDIGPGDFVGVYASRTIETIVNIVGIAKVGAAYVPINIDFPIERQKYILENSNCKKVLKAEDVNIQRINKSVKYVPRKKAVDKDPAYVIYTSGSTGVPKGVVISNEAICNTLIDINNRFKVTNDDKVIGISSFSFDLSVYDIFGTLAAGAMVYFVPDARDISNIITIVAEEGITIWNTVPAIMELYINEVENRKNRINKNYWDLSEDEIIEVDDDCDLRIVMLSGDWIPLTLPTRIKNEYEDIKIYSLGGATEAAIWSIYFPVEEINEEWNSIPYGYPLTNQSLFVLDDNYQLCPVGVTGQLYIGGLGLASCYLNDKEKTDQAFINNDTYGRIYRTGDFGVMRREGYIEFKGRKDEQVKIKGHRVELGEIEQVLLKHKDVDNVVVAVFKNNSNQNDICAYIESSNMPSEKELSEFALKYLPDYLVPHYYVKLNKIPLTQNGKFNKKLLPKPQAENNYDNYVEPRNETEVTIAKIWAKVMGTDKVGVKSNYFSIGGDSVTMVKIVSMIDNELHYKISLREFLNNSTISDLAELIKNNTNKKADVNDNENKLKQYKINVANIKINGQKNTESGILLTGATGFLGAHLLRELLENTKSNIYCLIRNENKLKKILEYYFGDAFYYENAERIRIIKGDVSEDILGLTKEQYNLLNHEIGRVYHAAANLNHFGDWNKSYKVNTIGTLNVALFCTSCNAEMHYMSTRMVSGENLVTQSQVNPIFNESCFDIGQRYWENIYIHSKYLSEEMLFKLKDKGLKVKIYRLGNISERSYDSKFQINELDNAVKNCEGVMEELGMISNYLADICIEKTPVDKCAKAIYMLSSIKEENVTYHVYNSREIRCIDYFKQKGYDLTIVPNDEYMNSLAEKAKSDMKYAIVFNYLTLFVNSRLNGRVRRDNTTTNKVLSNCGFTW